MLGDVMPGCAGARGSRAEGAMARQLNSRPNFIDRAARRIGTWVSAGRPPSAALLRQSGDLAVSAHMPAVAVAVPPFSVVAPLVLLSLPPSGTRRRGALRPDSGRGRGMSVFKKRQATRRVAPRRRRLVRAQGLNHFDAGDGCVERAVAGARAPSLHAHSHGRTFAHVAARRVGPSSRPRGAQSLRRVDRWFLGLRPPRAQRRQPYCTAVFAGGLGAVI